MLSGESGEQELDAEAAAQQQQQQARFNLAAQLAELAARARAAASGPRDLDADSPAARDARHRSEARLAQVAYPSSSECSTLHDAAYMGFLAAPAYSMHASALV